MSSSSLIHAGLMLVFVADATASSIAAGTGENGSHEIGSAGGLGAETSATSSPFQTKLTPKQAIHDGLLWLARHQNTDGSWSAAALKERCTPGKPCGVEIPKHPFTKFFLIESGLSIIRKNPSR